MTPAQFGLTRREGDVAALLIGGNTNKFIAHELCISLRTTKGHVAMIVSKLHAQSRTDAAVRLALASRGY